MKIPKVCLVLIFCLCLAGSVWAYQLEFSYGPNANYARVLTEHLYDLDQFSEDWTFDMSQGTATAEVWSPWESPSAIAKAVASPIGAGPVATVNLQVNNRTSWLSCAYGEVITQANFTILKQAGDTANQVPLNVSFHVTGILNLEGGAYYDYSYSFWLDGVEMHSSMGGPPTLDDLFSTILLLEVGLPHTFGIHLSGDLEHYTHHLNTALYQANLDFQVHETPLPPSLLLLGSGLLGLGFWGWRSRRG